MYDPVKSNNWAKRVLDNRPLESNRAFERRQRSKVVVWWVLSVLASWAAFLGLIVAFYRYSNGD